MQYRAPGPHFLGIGAQKAGTTWLWTQLKKHPRVWMPPRKEVHYFDRVDPAPNYLAEPNVLRRLFGKRPHHRTWRTMMQADVKQSIQQRNWAALRWHLQFYLGRQDDAWYRALFPATKNATTGEITPAYSILAEDDVAHIAKLFPALRVILLLRNPVERAWSQVRFDWTRGARAGLDNLDDIKAFIDSPTQERRSDYIRMLDVWGRHFPDEQFFVGFYEEVSESPAHLFARVLEFLHLPELPLSEEDLTTKVHVSREAAIPAEIHRYLAEKYLPQLSCLAERFGGPAKKWLEAAEQTVAVSADRSPGPQG